MKRKLYLAAGVLLLSVSALAQQYVSGKRTIEGGVNSLGTTTGSANAYVATMASGKPLLSYQLGACYIGKANFGNTATATLAIDGLSALTIKKLGGATNLVSGDIASGQLFTVCYDGTNLQLESSVGNASVGSGTVHVGVIGHLGYYNTNTDDIADMGADFTFATHTLTGGSLSIFDLSAAAVTAGLKIPSGAGAAPTADGILATDTTSHDLKAGSNGSTLNVTHPALSQLPATVKKRSLGWAWGDPAGSALTTASRAYYTVPFACTISSWDMSVDAGTATVDVWKIATGTANPTISNTITASALPAISTGTAIHSTTLTGWTTTVTANDIIGFAINAVATAKFVSIGIQCDE